MIAVFAGETAEMTRARRRRRRRQGRTGPLKLPVARRPPNIPTRKAARTATVAFLPDTCTPGYRIPQPRYTYPGTDRRTAQLSPSNTSHLHRISVFHLRDKTITTGVELHGAVNASSHRSILFPLDRHIEI